MTILGAQDKSSYRWWVDALFIFLILALCTIATYPQLESGDFPVHIGWAKELNENNFVLRPNILYQQLTIAFKAFIPFDLINLVTNDALADYFHAWYYRLPALLVTLVGYLWTALLLRNRFLKLAATELKHQLVLSWISAIVCMIVAPILLFTLGQRLIIGYINPNVWHNPTFSLLKPFALWIYFFVIDHWREKISWKQWLALGLMTGLSILAKPNFILSFLPALGLLLFLQTLSLRRLPWKLLSAMVIPAILVLAYQYVIMYSLNAENQIYMVPFKTAMFSAGNAINMVIFYLLSLLFPLLVSLFSCKLLRDRFGFNLVWLNFGITFITWLLFVELPHMSSLDFLWGPNLAVFILFVYCIGWLLQNPLWWKQQGWQTALTKAALGLHLVSGIVYSLITIFNPGRVR